MARLMYLFSCAILLAFGGIAAGADSPADEVDALSILEDPRRLKSLADEALAAGDREEAARRYRLMLERQEVARYLDYRETLAEALVAERLGDVDRSAELYRSSFSDDIHRTIQVLRIISVHPDRDRLVDEAYAQVRSLVEAARAGEQAQIYTTSKGAPRFLSVQTTDDVLEAANAGRIVRYCYVETLDLRGRQAELPERLQLDRCVVGNILAPDLDLGQFIFRGIVLGDVNIGTTWEGERNKSKTIPPSRAADLVFRDAIFVGTANFAGVTVSSGGRAYFPMAVFEAEADFKAAEFWGVTEFRYASFGADANFRNLRMHAPVYFGAGRYRADTVFTGLYSERDVYFNSVTFERSVLFDQCDWEGSATFEDAQFEGEANFGTTRVAKNLNLSRAVFKDELNIKDVSVGELDALGTHFHRDAWFTDAVVHGRTRFSLDEVTRHAIQQEIDALLPLYRHYQGDEDAEAPLTTQSSYGVTEIDDLTAKIEQNVSFANTVFSGYTVFEGVTFGREAGGVASFFNSQFLGETHFERSVWNNQADFSTIFGNEVAFNNATFLDSLILDDANVTGRVTLTDAVLADDANISFYGAELRSFQVGPTQIQRADGQHRLFYKQCTDVGPDRSDVRIERLLRTRDLDDDAIRALCYDFVIDEFVALKDSYGDRAMTAAEDDAYWWTRHVQAMAVWEFGTPLEQLRTLVVDFLLFELCFGWGVRLGNLAVAVLGVTVLFALLYRLFCADTVLVYDGEDMRIRDVSFAGLCFVSLQSLIAINTGWDFGDDDHTFRVLNTVETLVGFIILTFFVGAYTRMILA
ncbi:MAG: hypothetical protein ACI8PZ_000838 [Myxococcota bacterium]